MNCRVCVLFTLLAVSARAQGVELPPDLHVMKTPSSPAFAALGISPTEVQRPTTPSAFATEVLSRFRSADDTLTIPQGLAVEVAPYWLAPRYDLTFAEYAQEGFESIYRNATVSMATSGSVPDEENGEGALPSGTALAVGVRTTVFHPGLSADQKKCATDITRELAAQARVDAMLLDREARKRADEQWTLEHPGVAPPRKGSLAAEPVVPEQPPEVPVPVAPAPPARGEPNFDARFRKHQVDFLEYQTKLEEFERARRKREEYAAAKSAHAEWEQQRADLGKNLLAYNAILGRVTPEVNSELQAKANEEQAAELAEPLADCLRVLAARGDGLSMDVASAAAWSFPSTRFENGDFERILAWGTLAYTSGSTTFVALGRYVGADEGEEWDHGYDVGFRIIHARDRWGLSAEFVNRKLEDAMQRYAGSFDYRVTGDTWLTLTFGKDYGEGEEGGLLASIDLQFNLGEQSLKESRQLERSRQ